MKPVLMVISGYYGKWLAKYHYKCTFPYPDGVVEGNIDKYQDEVTVVFDYPK